MIRVFFSFLGSLFPAILCNVPRRNILLAGFAGMLGMLIKDQFSLLYLTLP